MKKIIVVCIILMASATLINAQEPSKPSNAEPAQQESQNNSMNNAQQNLSPEMDLFVQAYGLGLEGKYKESLEKFKEMEKNFPNSPYSDRVTFWQGWCHTELKNYGVAIKTFEKLVEKFPKSAYVDDALFKIGQIYENYQHDYDMAMKTYERLIKLFPAPKNNNETNSNFSNNVLSAQQNMAQIEERNQNNSRQALNDWQKSQTMNQGYRGNRRALKKDDYFTRRAQERIDFINKNSDNEYLPLTKFIEAKNLAKEGKYDDAIAKFRELSKDYSNSSLIDNAAFEIALCLKQKGETAKAMEILRNFAKLYPGSELLSAAEQLNQKWNQEQNPASKATTK